MPPLEEVSGAWGVHPKMPGFLEKAPDLRRLRIVSGFVPVAFKGELRSPPVNRTVEARNGVRALPLYWEAASFRRFPVVNVPEYTAPSSGMEKWKFPL